MKKEKCCVFFVSNQISIKFLLLTKKCTHYKMKTINLRKVSTMNLVNIENITKAYADRKLFENASFSLQEGEKVGIIGINGTGKTTLLKIIAGQEESDEGTITKANNLVIRYLPQHPEFPSEKTSQKQLRLLLYRLPVKWM